MKQDIAPEKLEKWDYNRSVLPDARWGRGSGCVCLVLGVMFFVASGLIVSFLTFLLGFDLPNNPDDPVWSTLGGGICIGSFLVAAVLVQAFFLFRKSRFYYRRYFVRDWKNHFPAWLKAVLSGNSIVPMPYIRSLPAHAVVWLIEEYEKADISDRRPIARILFDELPTAELKRNEELWNAVWPKLSTIQALYVEDRREQEKERREQEEKREKERREREKERREQEAEAQARLSVDRDMIEKLAALCHAYAANDRKQIRDLEPAATAIGERLHEAGGISEMRRIFNEIPDMRGKRTLEMHWGGIGDWRG